MHPFLITALRIILPSIHKMESLPACMFDPAQHIKTPSFKRAIIYDREGEGITRGEKKVPRAAAHSRLLNVNSANISFFSVSDVIYWMQKQKPMPGRDRIKEEKK